MTDYVTVAELKAQIGKSGAGMDTVLTALVTAASRAIDNFCGRPEGFVAVSTATARVYAGRGLAWQEIDECTEITLVAVKSGVTETTYTSWAATDWIAFTGDPKRPNFNRTPYTAILCSAVGDYRSFLNGAVGEVGIPTVQVTAKWGYATTVPAEIKQATLTQCARWFKRGESGWSDVLANAELGQLMYRKELDPDVKMMLVGGRYVRRSI